MLQEETLHFNYISNLCPSYMLQKHPEIKLLTKGAIYMREETWTIFGKIDFSLLLLFLYKIPSSLTCTPGYHSPLTADPLPDSHLFA